jgi:hypothetical protein
MPQFAADVQGMHQMRGSEILLSTLEVSVPSLMSSEVSVPSLMSSANGESLQKDAIRNDFNMRPQSPVSARKVPLLNGIFLAVVDSRFSNCPSHAAAELE